MIFTNWKKRYEQQVRLGEMASTEIRMYLQMINNVRKIHQPDPEDKNICLGCSNETAEYYETYPCPTIRVMGL